MSVVSDVLWYSFLQHPPLKLQKFHAPLNGWKELVRCIAHCHHCKVPSMLYSRFVDACCSNDILFIADTNELPTRRVRRETVGEVEEHGLLLLVQSTWIRNGTNSCQKVTVLEDIWSEINVFWIIFMVTPCINDINPFLVQIMHLYSLLKQD